MRVYKLKFETPIHIGKGALTSTSISICSDILFSAFCCEAVKIGKLDKLRYGDLLISDCFPFIDTDYYIPKPLGVDILSKSEDNDDVDKKKIKNLEFVSLSVLNEPLEDPEFEKEIQSNLGRKDDRQNLNSLGDPFFVTSFQFNREIDCGLYFLATGEEALVDELLSVLKFTGIGGKRSSGFGKFDYEVIEATDFDFAKTGDEYITLSTCMAKDDELEKALEGARYLLKKRSGYVSSFSYADTLLKKRDFYSFAAGSVFKNRFEGDIFDVSQDGNHPVWRYAKPLFLAV